MRMLIPCWDLGNLSPWQCQSRAERRDPGILSEAWGLLMPLGCDSCV